MTTITAPSEVNTTPKDGRTTLKTISEFVDILEFLAEFLAELEVDTGEDAAAHGNAILYNFEEEESKGEEDKQDAGKPDEEAGHEEADISEEEGDA